MTSHSLIEHKLRRYFYLGHEYLMYVPPSLRTSSADKKYQSDITGIKIIGKIVKKNKPEEINSIVPIILKIKKEDKLHDDQHLIFALAVCAGFGLKQCEKMVADAHAAVLTVCSDGLKLLMFVKFYKTAISILCKERYLPYDHKGFSHGFRKAVSDWYLKRDPFLTAEQIVRNKRYGGLSHNQVMKQIHISSSNPSHIIFIFHTIYGMDKVEEHFGSKLKDVNLKDEDETFENKQQKFIYTFLKGLNNLRKMDEITLRNEIELNCLGKQFEVIPKTMLSSSKILTALIKSMPLEAILDHTFVFAKRRVFHNPSNENGLREYISRFSNPFHVRKSRIHPIESFIEYAKYSRKRLNVLKFLNITSKELIDSKIELPEDQLKLFSGTKSHKDGDPKAVVIKKPLNTSEKTDESTVQSTVKERNKEVQASTLNPRKDIKVRQKENKLISTSSATKKNVVSKQKSDICEVSPNQSKQFKVLLKPLPKLEEEILTFLSEGLVKKTLEHIKPSGRKIIITYDSRMYLTNKKCAFTSLLYIHEAITLIILSLIFPEKSSDKPIIRSLDESGKQSNKEVKIDYEQPLTFDSLNSILFKVGDLNFTEKDIPDVNPLSTMIWAKEKKKECDVFVFLGSNKMDLKNIKEVKKEYQHFSNKPVKIIVCCLNGIHAQQANISRHNTLFIAGFDKNVGKLIDSFIKSEF